MIIIPSLHGRHLLFRSALLLTCFRGGSIIKCLDGEIIFDSSLGVSSHQAWDKPDDLSLHKSIAFKDFLPCRVIASLVVRLFIRFSEVSFFFFFVVSVYLAPLCLLLTLHPIFHGRVG